MQMIGAQVVVTDDSGDPADGLVNCRVAWLAVPGPVTFPAAHPS